MSIILNEGNNTLNVNLNPIVANLIGIVTDAQTGTPISGVKVTLGTKVTYTGSDGTYSISGVAPGAYSVTFEKSGYVTLVK